MKRSNHALALLGLLATTLCCGCQTFGTPTVRGQSPNPSSYSETTKIRGMYHTPIRSTAEELQDIYHEHHNTDTYYYTEGSNPGALRGAGASCPPGGQSCPPEGQSCPPGGQACPPGYGYDSCPPGGHGRCNTGLCQDKFSYAYQVPNDLVYPPAGGVGGAVVYPYYTLKGPSDFFRQ